MNWIVISMGLLFITLGALIKYAKWYWLIAGYNTATPEEKKNIDIEALSKVVSNALLAGGVAMFMLVVIISQGFAILGPIALFTGPVILALYLVWKTQKYNTTNPVAARKTAIWATIFVGVLVLTIGVSIFYSSRPAVVAVSQQQIRISGTYGITEPMKNIQEVKLLDEIPDVKWKSNGFGFANVRKGKFHLQDWGEGKLFLHAANGPFIYIKTVDSYMLINYKDPEQTNEVYQQLYANWKK
jgi:hypothetical protein